LQNKALQRSRFLRKRESAASLWQPEPHAAREYFQLSHSVFCSVEGKRRQGHAGVLRGDANNHGQSIITVLGLVLAIAEFSQEGLGRDQRLDRDLERGGDRREVGQVGHAETPLPF
jgi:hypothetical protein